MITLLTNENGEILTTATGALITADSVKGFTHLPASLIVQIANNVERDANQTTYEYTDSEYGQMTAAWMTGYRSPLV